MSVENTTQHQKPYSGLQIVKGLAELNGLRSAFLDEIQEQQQKQKSEQRRNVEPSAAEVRQEPVSRGEELRNEKKSLNKSELRSEQLEADYNEKQERRKTLNDVSVTNSLSDDFRNDFYNSTENIEPFQPEQQSVPSIHSATLAGNTSSAIPLNPSVPLSTALSSSVTPAVVPASPPNAVTPISLNGTVPQSVSMVPNSSTASLLTVFTAAGQFQKTPKEDKEETKNEEKNGKKKEKKGTFVSLLQQSIEPKPIERKRTPSFLHLTNSASETTVNPAEAPQKQAGQSKKTDKTEKDISLEALLERLEKPVPMNEPLPTETSETTQTSRLQEQNDRILFVQRIAAACQSAANQNGTVRMKLDLGTLGSITFWAATRDRKMSVRFEAQRQQTAQLLSDSVNELREALNQKRITLEDVEIKTIG